MTYTITVDLSHNEQIEDFPDISLEEEYDLDYIEDWDKDRVKLDDSDILFIGNILHLKNSKNDKFTPDQLKDIKKFVGDGGGLLLTTSVGGDQDILMKEGSMRVLYKLTGVKRFWNGSILETGSNFIVNKENLLISELYAHPITKGISELIFPNCTFFSLAEEEVEDIVSTSEKAEFKYFYDNEVSEVGPVPICAVSSFFSGRCVTIGSSDWLYEDTEYGIDAGNNMKFLENVIRWLTFEI